MHPSADLRLRLANDRIARDHRHAADTRLARKARHRLRPSLRRAVGRSMIEIGQKLAAEQSLTPRPVPLGPGRASKGNHRWRSSPTS